MINTTIYACGLSTNRTCDLHSQNGLFSLFGFCFENVCQNTLEPLTKCDRRNVVAWESQIIAITTNCTQVFYMAIKPKHIVNDAVNKWHMISEIILRINITIIQNKTKQRMLLQLTWSSLMDKKKPDLKNMFNTCLFSRFLNQKTSNQYSMVLLLHCYRKS